MPQYAILYQFRIRFRLWRAMWLGIEWQTFDGAGSADVMCDELSYGSVIHHVVGISHSVCW